MVSRITNQRQQEEYFGHPLPYQNTNSGTSITPDVTLAESHVYTMTGNLTVGAPANTGTLGVGDKIYLVFVQDATAGRTLTWNAAYRNAPTGLGGSATAGQRASFEFRWDGVSMQYTGGSTAFA